MYADPDFRLSLEDVPAFSSPNASSTPAVPLYIPSSIGPRTRESMSSTLRLSQFTLPSDDLWHASLIMFRTWDSASLTFPISMLASMLNLGHRSHFFSVICRTPNKEKSINRSCSANRARSMDMMCWLKDDSGERSSCPTTSPDSLRIPVSPKPQKNAGIYPARRVLSSECRIDSSMSRPADENLARI